MSISNFSFFISGQSGSIAKRYSIMSQIIINQSILILMLLENFSEMWLNAFLKFTRINVKSGTFYFFLSNHVSKFEGYLVMVFVMVEIYLFWKVSWVLVMFYFALEIEDQHLILTEIAVDGLGSYDFLEGHVLELYLRLRSFSDLLWTIFFTGFRIRRFIELVHASWDPIFYAFEEITKLMRRIHTATLPF